MKAFGPQVGNAVPSLEPALDQQTHGGNNQRPLAFKQCRVNDHVAKPAFVLKGQKAHALGGGWPLAGDHDTGHPHPRTVSLLRECRRRQHPLSTELRSQMGKRVRAHGQGRMLVVRRRAFGRAHLRQRTAIRRWR